MKKKNDKAELKKTSNVQALAAEVELSFTKQYAGDNYQIEVSFDKNFQNICAKSIPFVAWKRMYLEIDKMYKKGATVTEKFEQDGNSEPDVITVDNTEDFAAGQKVIFFDEGKTDIETVVVNVDNVSSKITVTDLHVDNPQGRIVLEKYSGVRLKDDETFFDVSLDLLPNAYGDKTDGTDGGTFVEFITDFANNGSGKVPRYKILNENKAGSFAWHWFNNKTENTGNPQSQNLFQVVVSDISDIVLAGSERRAVGIAVPALNVLLVFNSHFVEGRKLENLSQTAISEILSHEIGHQLLELATIEHVDSALQVDTHDNQEDSCVMTYKNDLENKIVEFDIQCIYKIRDAIEFR